MVFCHVYLAIYNVLTNWTFNFGSFLKITLFLILSRTVSL